MQYLAPEEARTKQGNLRYLEQLRILARNNRQNPTPAENKIWQWLRRRQLQFKFLRQKPIGKYILDFYCSKLLLAIEVDGDSHDPKKFSDQNRDLYLEQRGIKTVRYENEDISGSLQQVKLNLIKTIKQRHEELTHPDKKPFI